MLKPLEVEFKYRADDIPLSVFMDFCKIRKPQKEFNSSGYDHFYGNPNEPDSFYRHRKSPDLNQLTFKRKTVASNSFVRTEHNLDFLPMVTQDQVEALCAESGYKYSHSIFKTCFVFKYDLYVLSYYFCYDKEMKELGRFIEIEMNEDYKWSGQDETYRELLVMEHICGKSLGVTAKVREKLSLYEMFRPATKEISA